MPVMNPGAGSLFRAEPQQSRDIGAHVENIVHRPSPLTHQLLYKHTGNREGSGLLWGGKGVGKTPVKRPFKLPHCGT